MKERPILFSGPLVRAILQGRKTQTRRIVGRGTKLPDGFDSIAAIHKDGSGEGFIAWLRGGNVPTPEETALMYPEKAGFGCPYGKPGDLLWVREHHARIPGMNGNHNPHYFADGPMPTIEHRYDVGLLKSYPSIHMPRWASRINLEITGVRVEQLQDIIREDAIAEGLSCLTKDGSLYKYGIADRDGLPGNDDFGWHWQKWAVDPCKAYKTLWESINGPGSWDANPWVWVIEFKRI